MLSGIYHLARKTDQTGVSGTGIVAYVVILPDGACITRWHNTQYKSTVMWDSWQHMKAVHVDCHPGCNELVGPLVFEGELEEKSFPYEKFVHKNMDGVEQPDSSVCPICGDHCAELINAFGNRGKKMAFCLGAYLEPGELRHVVCNWNMFCETIRNRIKQGCPTCQEHKDRTEYDVKWVHGEIEDQSDEVKFTENDFDLDGLKLDIRFVEKLKHKFASYLVVAHNFGGGYAEKMVDYIVANDAGTVNSDVGYKELQEFARRGKK